MNTVYAVAWLAIAVALFFIELATYQMLCIWFSVGALAALLSGFLGASGGIQLLAFLLFSIVALLVFRPLVKSKIRVKKSPTNADSVIGQTGLVREEIDNGRQTGRVYANGLDWTARSVHDSVIIPAQSKVRAVRIEGVKLIVEPVEEPDETKE